MKKTTIASTLIMTLLLAGCSNGGESSQQSSVISQAAASEEESTDSDSSAAEQTSAPVEAFQTAEVTSDSADVQTSEADWGEFSLYGPGGDMVTQSEITRIVASDEEDYKKNGISATNWLQAEISGFTYLAEPGGEYRRVNIGDEICGLKVFDAGCVFDAGREIAEGEFSNESYFSSGYAEFEGSKEVSGTLSILAEDNGMLEPGSVIFTPDSGTELPVMNYTFSGETGITCPQEAKNSYIVLTDVTVENDGAHATLTMNNISVSGMVNSFTIMRASASDVTFG